MFGLGYGICKLAEVTIAATSSEKTKLNRDQQGRAVSFALAAPIVMALDPVGTSAYMTEAALETKRADNDSRC